MKKRGLLMVGFLLLGTFALAQGKQDSVCEVHYTVPKPGSSKAFEEGRKKHNLYHKGINDKNAILIWEIVTSQASGNYLTTICGQTWKEMDAFDQKSDSADVEKTMGPATAQTETSYYVYRADMSNAPEPSTPSKYMTAVDYVIKPSGVQQFIDSVKRINAAMAQTKYPAKPSRWYVLANGNIGPRFVVVTDRAGFADMQGPEQTMADMLKQAYGPDDKTLQNLRDTVDHTESYMYQYRADLSYIPTK